MVEDAQSLGERVQSEKTNDWKQFWIGAGAVVGITGSVGTLASFFPKLLDPVWTGTALVILTLVATLCLFPPFRRRLQLVFSVIRFILRIYKYFEDASESQSRIKLTNHSLEVRDAVCFFGAHKELFDICSVNERQLRQLSSPTTTQARNKTPNVWMIETVREFLTLIAALFRQYTLVHKHIYVMLLGRDSSNSNKLVTILTMNGIPDRRFRDAGKSFEPLSDSVPGKVLDNGVGVIVSEVSKLAVDAKWKDRADYVNSFVAWPVYVGGQVAFVLKIESSERNLFRDTGATRLLVELCCRKLGAVFETANCLQRFERSPSSSPPSHASHEPNGNEAVHAIVQKGSDRDMID